VVATTLTVFVSGIVLLIHGPRERDALVLVHKASFVIWLVVGAVHVLGHLPIMVRVLRPGSSGSLAGVAGRRIALVGALAGGLVIAVALIPDFSAWTAPVALHHHPLARRSKVTNSR
jgi:hypothetical protein